MASSEHVLRIRRVYERRKDDGDDDDNNDPNDFVFLHISCETPHPISLRLLATEGENAYVATINSTQIQAARDTKSPLTPPQWSDTLLSLLLQRRPSIPADATTTTSNIQADDEKIEFVASTASSSSASSSQPSELNLLVRKNTSGITQRLGTLTLPHDDNEVLDTLHWTSIAIDRANILDQEVASLTTNYNAAEKTVASLTSQLEELIAAKKAHESVLMRKCQELLNQKKLKIREQQRLLASTSSDRRQGERKLQKSGDSKKVAGAKTGMAATKTAAGTRKRKAEDAALDEGGGGDDEEDAFEALSPPRRKVKKEEEKEEKVEEDEKEEEKELDENIDDSPETPNAHDDHDDDITEDEETDLLHDTNNEGQAAGTRSEQMQVEESSPPLAARDLPPDRDLPFSNAASKPAYVAAAAAAAGEEVGDEDGKNYYDDDEDEDEDEDEDDDEL